MEVRLSLSPSWLDGKSILELGAGTGVLGIWLWAMMYTRVANADVNGNNNGRHQHNNSGASSSSPTSTSSTITTATMANGQIMTTVGGTGSRPRVQHPLARQRAEAKRNGNSNAAAAGDGNTVTNMTTTAPAAVAAITTTATTSITTPSQPAASTTIIPTTINVVTCTESKAAATSTDIPSSISTSSLSCVSNSRERVRQSSKSLNGVIGGGCVVVSDLPEVIDLMQENAEINRALFAPSLTTASSSSSVSETKTGLVAPELHACVLCWGEELDRIRPLPPYDIILVSDCMYNNTLFPILMQV
jgi:predicted nicotinamide N-methyase